MYYNRYTEKEIMIMGDLAKKKNIADKIAEREQRKAETVHVENETIETIARKPRVKDKMISLRVNSSTYTRFKKICDAKGFTANSALNGLISDFIRDNKDYLED